MVCPNQLAQLKKSGKLCEDSILQLNANVLSLFSVRQQPLNPKPRKRIHISRTCLEESSKFPKFHGL
ncbi:hypothetical protein T11_4541 [Trichinella zimbabwensis]|uniref:Uncharacterized protein n=1 Tax=Trichinella zimbabwensis TaxID=268475 RepID=A0A0V1HX15_9BILA|nr:hypothetical protein T11_4541 [Trichinella zimbabwensis]